MSSNAIFYKEYNDSTVLYINKGNFTYYISTAFEDDTPSTIVNNNKQERTANFIEASYDNEYACIRIIVITDINE